MVFVSHEFTKVFTELSKKSANENKTSQGEKQFELSVKFYRLNIVESEVMTKMS